MAIWSIAMTIRRGCLCQLIHQQAIEFVAAVQVFGNAFVFNGSNYLARSLIAYHHVELFLDAVKRERQCQRTGRLHHL